MKKTHFTRRTLSVLLVVAVLVGSIFALPLFISANITIKDVSVKLSLYRDALKTDLVDLDNDAIKAGDIFYVNIGLANHTYNMYIDSIQYFVSMDGQPVTFMPMFRSISGVDYYVDYPEINALEANYVAKDSEIRTVFNSMGIKDNRFFPEGSALATFKIKINDDVQNGTKILFKTTLMKIGFWNNDVITYVEGSQFNNFATQDLTLTVGEGTTTTTTTKATTTTTTKKATTTTKKATTTTKKATTTTKKATATTTKKVTATTTKKATTATTKATEPVDPFENKEIFFTEDLSGFALIDRDIIPSDSKLIIEEVEISAAQQAALDAYDFGNRDLSKIVVFDMRFEDAQGKEITVNGKVKVLLFTSDWSEGATFVYISDDGKVVEIEAEYMSFADALAEFGDGLGDLSALEDLEFGGMLTFTVDHFSNYAIVNLSGGATTTTGRTPAKTGDTDTMAMVWTFVLISAAAVALVVFKKRNSFQA